MLWKSKKIIFIGSHNLLLKILARENETEVISSINFLYTLAPRFVPDLIVFDSIRNSDILEIRKTQIFSATPILIVEDDFNSAEALEEISGYMNVILCNSSICTENVFIEHLKSIMTKEKAILNARTGRTVKRAVHFLNNHIHEKITRKEISIQLDVDEDYLTRIFHLEMGMGLWDYLNMLRLDEAKKLLLYTGLSVKDISKKCGFTSSNYFSNTFKKRFGMTPGKVRG